MGLLRVRGRSRRDTRPRQSQGRARAEWPDASAGRRAHRAARRSARRDVRAVCGWQSRNMKTGIRPVQADSVLQGVLSLPIAKWHYKTETPDVQHIGPMAQDFKATFGVGADDH